MSRSTRRPPRRAAATRKAKGPSGNAPERPSSLPRSSDGCQPWCARLLWTGRVSRREGPAAATPGVAARRPGSMVNAFSTGAQVSRQARAVKSRRGPRGGRRRLASGVRRPGRRALTVRRSPPLRGLGRGRLPPLRWPESEHVGPWPVPQPILPCNGGIGYPRRRLIRWADLETGGRMVSWLLQFIALQLRSSW